MASTDWAVETAALARAFEGHPALDGLDLRVATGEVLALLGPNGAGKTTSVRVLNGLVRADRGTARVLGFDPATDGHEIRLRTGVLTEQAGLDDRLTALENLVAAARLRGIAPEAAGRRGVALLDRFGLGPMAHRRVHGLSTGERKRLALARALLHDPELLFLDEPTAGLDPEGTRDVLDLIASLASDRGRTVVLCTHHLAEAERLANRIAILDRGRTLAHGTIEELAGRLWPDLRVAIDLGGTAPDPVRARLASLEGVRAVEPADCGAQVVVADRSRIPALVSALASSGAPVYGVVARPPSLDELYFSLLEASR